MPEDRRERAFREELLETMFRRGPGEPAAVCPSTLPSEAISQGGPEVASRAVFAQYHLAGADTGVSAHRL